MTSTTISFGSHRSHGEILAKGLSAIHKLSDSELYNIMKEFLGGSILKVVEGKEEVLGNVKELAIDFLLYGALAEVFARTTGFNRGLGGSMHAFFIPFGIFPNNAIVGGSAGIALGAALYKKSNAKKGIVVANCGDGAMGRGPVLEALNIVGDGPDPRALGPRRRYADPLQYFQQSLRYGRTDRRRNDGLEDGGAASAQASIRSKCTRSASNGYDPLAVIDAFARKKELLVRGEGPALLEVVTYRVSGHSPSDSSTYRTPEEIEAWKAADPIKAYREKLILGGIASESELDAIHDTIVRPHDENLQNGHRRESFPAYGSLTRIPTPSSRLCSRTRKSRSSTTERLKCSCQRMKCRV